MSDISPDNRLPALPEDKEIDLWELLQSLWAGRWTIALVTVVFLTLSITYLHIASYRYTAKLVLFPVQSGGAPKVEGLGGLASFAGVSLPQGPGALSFSAYKQGVHSRNLADTLAQNQELMHKIFAPEWNEKRGVWQEPETSLGPLKSAIKNIIGIPDQSWRPPDGARLEEYINNQVQVIEDPKSPYITITFKHADPEFAVYFLDMLNTELDGILRKQTLLRSTDNISYLSAQLGKATITEHRLVIAQALVEQEKQRMMANARAPYAADPVGSASASAWPTSPEPVKVLAVGLLGGLIAGGTVVIAIASARKRHKKYLTRQEADQPDLLVS